MLMIRLRVILLSTYLVLGKYIRLCFWVEVGRNYLIGIPNVLMAKAELSCSPCCILCVGNEL